MPNHRVNSERETRESGWRFYLFIIKRASASASFVSRQVTQNVGQIRLTGFILNNLLYGLQIFNLHLC